jgi:hypothetical protein
LNKDIKYNLNHKQKDWLNNLAFEAQTAITLLPTGELPNRTKYKTATKSRTKQTNTRPHAGKEREKDHKPN